MSEIKRPKINNNQKENKKPKLLNTHQNKRLLSIKIEEYFSKSNLKSLELSYEKKNSCMKELLFKFHIFYNSLTQIKSSLNIEKKNIKKYIISNKEVNSNKALLLITKKKISTFQIHKTKKNIKTTQEKYDNSKKTLKPMKSFTYKLKNDVLLNDIVLKTERSLNILEGNLKYQKTNENKNKNYIFTSQNKLRRIMGDSNINKSKKDFNEKKIKYNKIIKTTKIIGKEKYNNNKKIIFYGNNSDNNIKINRSINSIQLQRNSNNYIEGLNEKYIYVNFNQININIKNNNRKKNNSNNSNRTIKNLNISKEEPIFQINKNYKFKQRYTFQNENNNINTLNIINRIYTAEREKNSSVKEKTKKQNKNKFLLFFTDKNNYNILKIIYDFLYKNENLKDMNMIKNIIGPFREIYLNKCISEIENQLEKFEMKKKNNDIWNVMEKEVLIHKMNKINEFIQENNKKIANI